MMVPLHSRQDTPLKLLEPLRCQTVKFFALIKSVVVLTPWRSDPVTVIPPAAISLFPVLLTVRGSAFEVLLVEPNSMEGQVNALGLITIAVVDARVKFEETLFAITPLVSFAEALMVQSPAPSKYH